MTGESGGNERKTNNSFCVCCEPWTDPDPGDAGGAVVTCLNTVRHGVVMGTDTSLMPTCKKKKKKRLSLRGIKTAAVSLMCFT